MKLHVLSDLHLSVQGLAPPATDADLVVLAGDIARPQQALAWAAGLGKPALYVPGNHEFYGGSLPGVVRALREHAEGSNVRILDNDECTIGDVRFLGTTLWSDFELDPPGPARELAEREALEKVHDFRRIFVDEEQRTTFTPRASAGLFARNAAWLEAKLRTPWHGSTVVITHHAPSARSVHPRFAGSPLNACFTSHLDRLLDGSLAQLWIHGHMHHSVDYDVRGTRVVCNPRGYAPGGKVENPDFDPAWCIDVPA